MSKELQRNLSVITGNGSLVKLNIADQSAMAARVRLLTKYGRDTEAFTSAVTIYLCNVLDAQGFGLGYSERGRLIPSLSFELTRAWLMEYTGGYTQEELNRWIDEVFEYGQYDPAHRPSPELLKLICDDFARISATARAVAYLL